MPRRQESHRTMEAGESPATDEQLYLRYRDRRDLEAFETLVHRYERPLFGYLQRYLANATLAEEVFQAVFLRVFEKAHLFSHEHRFRPWLYRVATHEAIDTLRRERKFQAASLDESYGETSDGSASRLLDLLVSAESRPDDQVALEEQRAWARAALDDLSPPLRATVMLVFFQDLKYREVAETLQIPVGTVKSRMHKALLNLNAAWRRAYPPDTHDELDAD